VTTLSNSRLNRSLVDGEPDLGLPITDRGLNYGDGLFETLLVRGGRPCQWPRHRRRLELGGRRLGLVLPPAELLAEEASLLTRGIADGVLKILITRGDGGRGYRPMPGAAPRRVLTLHPVPDYPAGWYREGVALRRCATPATHNPALAGIKHLNRLDSVLARAEWDDPAIAEGLMSGPDGALIGGTMTNLFLWDGSRLSTPAVDCCGIAGTVRELALEIASDLGISCAQERVSPTDLARARGLFLTNSVAGVWPVRQLEDHRYDVAQLPLDFIAGLHRAACTPEGTWP